MGKDASSQSLGVSQEPLAVGLHLAGARYTLKRLIGRGTATEVWLAWDREFVRDIALKCLPFALFQDAALLDRLKLAAARWTQLDHPAIARVHNLALDHRVVAVSMEYVEAWSLATMKLDRPQRRYRTEEIALWLSQVCAALEYAHHDAKIFHGGLCPANLLLDTHDRIKVTDFGLGRLIAPWLQGNRTESSATTKAPARASEPAAMQESANNAREAFHSPQQVRGEDATALDDIYSLGATIFDLLTGTPPFESGDIRAQVLELPPPTMTERLQESGVRDSLPRSWEETVAACLAKDPDRRPQSAAEVLKLLDRPASSGESMVPESENSTSKPNRAQVDRLPGRVAEDAFSPKSTPTAGNALPGTETDGAATITSGAAAWGHRFPMRAILASAGVVLVLLGLMLGLWIAPHLSHESKEKRSGSGNERHSGKAGWLDIRFNPGTAADNEIRSLATQTDGRILVGGKFRVFDGAPAEGIARLNVDGSLEKAFLPRAQGTVYAMALQGNGKILLAGDFTNVCDKVRRRVARLNRNGTLDAGFDPGMTAQPEVRALLVQKDGKIITGGTYSWGPGNQQKPITRLNQDGTPDRTFNPGAGPDGSVLALAQQPDRKILVAGSFVGFDGQPCGRIVRLNPDGRLDPSFTGGVGTDAIVFALSLEPNGKVLIAGDFNFVHGKARNHIARLLPNGTIDESFNPGDGPNSSILALACQSDGRILIGGGFTTCQDAHRKGTARLQSDGTLDRTFDPGEGAADAVWSLALQRDGNVLVGGAFTGFNGASCGHIARLLGN